MDILPYFLTYLLTLAIPRGAFAPNNYPISTRLSFLTDIGVKQMSCLIQLLQVQKIQLEVLGHMRPTNSPDSADLETPDIGLLLAPENVRKTLNG